MNYSINNYDIDYVKYHKNNDRGGQKLRKQGLQKIVTIITIISIVITIISLGFNLILPKYLAYKLNGELGTVSSIGIIGGVDGPTAVYITSQLSPYIFTYIFLLISIAGILYLFFTRKMAK